jgi:hypothetical protein
MRVVMNTTPACTPIDIPADAAAFAREQQAERYLCAVIEMTQRLFPGAAFSVELEEDPEIAGDRHITLVSEPMRMSPETAAETLGRWDREVFQVCPAHLVWVFRVRLSLR